MPPPQLRRRQQTIVKMRKQAFISKAVLSVLITSTFIFILYQYFFPATSSLPISISISGSHLNTIQSYNDTSYISPQIEPDNQHDSWMEVEPFMQSQPHELHEDSISFEESNTSQILDTNVTNNNSEELSKRQDLNKRHDEDMNRIIPVVVPHVSKDHTRRTYITSSQAFMERREEMRRAKMEIEHGKGSIGDDPDLYWPLFHNLTKFKRSYALMERTFKVYMYREGKKPIFLWPELKGIYAAEGWFMKIMIEDRKFVVRDPNKAHMFYLPYSVHQLVKTMYIPNSHNMQPLALFLKDYVNMIAAKYPFWNRTHGSDHFFVACHDWGPYTTAAHQELKNNAVKALCNADLSEGYFVTGRDVSLPEANLHAIRRTDKNLGGKPASERSILAFFAGNMHGSLRPILLQYWKNKDDDMRIYEHIPSHILRKMSYIQHMKSSKYCICPKGFEVNSPRIVEAIYYECVPVIISDNFVPPLSEVLNWNAFSVIVAEKDIPRLKDILLSIPQKRYLSMQLRVRKVQQHFVFHRKPIRYDLFHMILHSIWLNMLNQIE